MPPGVKTVGASVNCVCKGVHLHGAPGGSRSPALVWKGRTVLGPPPPPGPKWVHFGRSELKGVATLGGVK